MCSAFQKRLHEADRIFRAEHSSEQLVPSLLQILQTSFSAVHIADAALRAVVANFLIPPSNNFYLALQ